MFKYTMLALVASVSATELHSKMQNQALAEADAEKFDWNALKKKGAAALKAAQGAAQTQSSSHQGPPGNARQMQMQAQAAAQGAAQTDSEKIDWGAL